VIPVMTAKVESLAVVLRKRGNFNRCRSDAVFSRCESRIRRAEFFEHGLDTDAADGIEQRDGVDAGDRQGHYGGGG